MLRMKFRHRLQALMVLLIISMGTVVPLYADQSSVPKPDGWSVMRDPLLGSTLYYPDNWFEPQGLDNGVYSFTSKFKDGSKLTLKVFLDPMRTGAPDTVKALKAAPEASLIGEVKQGANWYEARGKTADGLLSFSRVIYSCKERVVSEMTMIYPAASARAYEAAITKMRKRFGAGIGTRTPVRQCS